jgi:hypothetical protein
MKNNTMLKEKSKFKALLSPQGRNAGLKPPIFLPLLPKPKSPGKKSPKRLLKGSNMHSATIQVDSLLGSKNMHKIRPKTEIGGSKKKLIKHKIKKRIETEGRELLKSTDLRPGFLTISSDKFDSPLPLSGRMPMSPLPLSSHLQSPSHQFTQPPPRVMSALEGQFTQAKRISQLTAHHNTILKHQIQSHNTILLQQ